MVVERLAATYEARCELDYEGPFQLLIATILSAQTTDVQVNLVTPELFGHYPTAGDLARADPAEVERIVKATGFFRAKTKSIIRCSNALVDRFGGQVPPRMEDLVTLPGIGRKTANVVLGVGFKLPGLAVDTHVTRLTNLLKIASSDKPEVIEAQVCSLAPPAQWTDLGLRLILHGRRVCTARKPNCEGCLLNDFCPSSTVLAS
ncbi:MAG TPA: endonuclease III [Candidatus Dormibacteraeota bacterium]|jgi:endonuclease-3|nr:endonuclease III [Candidatus Dormibacteraeota bacterium]